MQEIELAIHAYHNVLQLQGSLKGHVRSASCRLIVAGGYDKRLAENVEYWDELKDLAQSLGIDEHVSAILILSLICLEHLGKALNFVVP